MPRLARSGGILARVMGWAWYDSKLTLEIISLVSELLKYFFNPGRNPWESLTAGARRKNSSTPIASMLLSC